MSTLWNALNSLARPLAMAAPLALSLALLGVWDRHDTPLIRGARLATGWWWHVARQAVTGRDGWAAAIAAVPAGALLAVASRWPLLTLTGWAATVAVCARLRAQAPGWWTARILDPALVVAGILPAPGEGQKLVVHRAGQPVHTPHGTTVQLSLPPGMTASKAATRAEALASALRVPAALLTITQQPSDPANRIRVTVATPVDWSPRGSVYETTVATTWSDPIIVGRDARGRDLTIPTFDASALLVGGLQGSGKTTMLRVVAAHFALDPTARIFGCDGKGKVSDWGGFIARAEQWVMLSEPNAGQRLLSMLRDVQSLVDERNAQARRNYPGVLVLLEEFTRFRLRLPKKETEELDAIMKDLLAVGRAANVFIAMVGQRPSAEMIKTDYRDLAGVGVCFEVKNTDVMKMVLGHVSDLPIPTEKGRAITNVGDRDTEVQVDYIDDTTWNALCARLPHPPVRKVQQPAHVVSGLAQELAETPEDVAPDERPDDEPAPVMSPLLAAVVDLLEAAPDHRLTPGQLNEALPPHMRFKIPSQLSAALKLAAGGWETRMLRLGPNKSRWFVLADLYAAHPQYRPAGRPSVVPRDDAVAL